MSEQGEEPRIEPQPGELGEGRVDVPGGGPGGVTDAPDEEEDDDEDAGAVH